jgi:hypothetical protein
MSKQIKLSEIRFGGIFTRAHVDKEAVADYRARFEDGSPFPPIDLYYDGEIYWCADGVHRLTAATGLEHETIAAEIFKGGKREALEHAVKANWAHGVRRTSADKRQAVSLVLGDEIWREWSDRRVAEFCGVSDHLVAAIRGEIQVRERAPDEKPPKKTRIGKDGKRHPAKKEPAAAVELAEAESDDFDPKALDAATRKGIDIAGLASPYRKAVRELGAISKQFKELAAEERTGMHLCDTINRITHDLNLVIGTISQAEPVCLCQMCDGDGCRACANSGFWTRGIRGSRKT